MKRLLTSLLLIPFISSCKYASMIEAGNACNLWEQERKGVFEVDYDRDGRQGLDTGVGSLQYALDGTGPKFYRSPGTTYEIRECSSEESTKQIIGKEYITPWKILMTEDEFKAVEIVYKKFPY